MIENRIKNWLLLLLLLLFTAQVQHKPGSHFPSTVVTPKHAAITR
ncbi:MAG: hypothetical protein FD181_1304 [Prolixibacteraceae bacterium]|nr:MAG: hypothetical protein FD181_1304 [Prolixibacteraceae bacterium]